MRGAGRDGRAVHRGVGSLLPALVMRTPPQNRFAILTLPQGEGSVVKVRRCETPTHRLRRSPLPARGRDGALFCDVATLSSFGDAEGVVRRIVPSRSTTCAVPRSSGRRFAPPKDDMGGQRARHRSRDADASEFFSFRRRVPRSAASGTSAEGAAGARESACWVFRCGARSSARRGDFATLRPGASIRSRHRPFPARPRLPDRRIDAADLKPQRGRRAVSSTARPGVVPSCAAASHARGRHIRRLSPPPLTGIRSANGTPPVGAPSIERGRGEYGGGFGGGDKFS